MIKYDTNEISNDITKLFDRISTINSIENFEFINTSSLYEIAKDIAVKHKRRLIQKYPDILDSNQIGEHILIKNSDDEKKSISYCWIVLYSKEADPKFEPIISLTVYDRDKKQRLTLLDETYENLLSEMLVRLVNSVIDLDICTELDAMDQIANIIPSDRYLRYLTKGLAIDNWSNIANVSVINKSELPIASLFSTNVDAIKTMLEKSQVTLADKISTLFRISDDSKWGMDVSIVPFNEGDNADKCKYAIVWVTEGDHTGTVIYEASNNTKEENNNESC